MKSIRRLMMSCCVCFCVCLAGFGISHRALGQSPPPVKTASFVDLATAISKSFPLAGANAFAGRDWCLEVESDPNPDWWYLRFDNTLDAHQSQYGKRIRLTYTRTTKTRDGNDKEEYGFASIFLGIDLLQSYDYGST